MQAKKVTLLVAGVLVGLLGLILASAGGFLVWAYGTQREDGYFTRQAEPFATARYALVSDDIDLRLGTTAGPGDWIPDLGDIQVRLRVTDPQGNAVFVGIAPATDVARYLEGVGHSVISRIEDNPFRVTYRDVDGGEPVSQPEDQAFWVASTSGPGTQTLLWDVREGEWDVVVMNADAGPDVGVRASVGARADFMLPLTLGLLIFGLIALAGGTLMVVAGARVPPARTSEEGPPREPDRTEET